MKRIVLAAVGAAVLGLTACSGGAPAAAPGNAPVPVSCAEQYKTWDHGRGTGLVAAIHAVSEASTAGNAKVLTEAGVDAWDTCEGRGQTAMFHMGALSGLISRGGMHDRWPRKISPGLWK